MFFFLMTCISKENIAGKFHFGVQADYLYSFKIHTFGQYFSPSSSREDLKLSWVLELAWSGSQVEVLRELGVRG